MSSKNSDCRFCLRKLDSNERMALIDEEINDQFTSITQVSLEFSDELSHIICELCLRSLQLASALKIQFIENQKKLLSINDNGHINSPIEQPLTSMEPKMKKRKRESNQKSKTPEIDYVDPLQLVSVQENVHDDGNPGNPDNYLLEIKQERADTPNNSYGLHNEDRKSRGEAAAERRREARRLRDLAKKFAGEQTTFKCPHCSNIYKRKPHMVRHIEVAHMNAKYVCMLPGCELYFVRKERLRKHVEMSHTNLSPLEMSMTLDRIRRMKPIYGDVKKENPDQANADDEDGESGNQDEDQPFDEIGATSFNQDVFEQDRRFEDERETMFQNLRHSMPSVLGLMGSLSNNENPVP